MSVDLHVIHFPAGGSEREDFLLETSHNVIALFQRLLALLEVIEYKMQLEQPVSTKETALSKTSLSKKCNSNASSNK